MHLYRPVHEFLRSKPPRLVFALCLLYILAIGALDWHTGARVILSVFYLPAIACTAWYGTRAYAYAAAVIGGLCWVMGMGADGYGAAVMLWNGAVAISTFAFVAHLIAHLKQKIAGMQEQAATDPLTGALNRRAFMDRLNLEIEFLKRHGLPSSVAYCDLDDFKQVNDHFGHEVGDEVLKSFVMACKQRMRKTDVVARIGGDEFVLLLSGAAEDAAMDALGKLKAEVQQIFDERGWAVTLSIGLVSFQTLPASGKDLIGATDEVMYRAKRGGKNRIERSTYAGARPVAQEREPYRQAQG